MASQATGAGGANVASLLEGILGQLAEMNTRAKQIATAGDGALAEAVTAVVSGHIGGRYGLGYAAAGYGAGAMARY